MLMELSLVHFHFNGVIMKLIDRMARLIGKKAFNHSKLLNKYIVEPLGVRCLTLGPTHAICAILLPSSFIGPRPTAIALLHKGSHTASCISIRFPKKL